MWPSSMKPFSAAWLLAIARSCSAFGVYNGVSSQLENLQKVMRLDESPKQPDEPLHCFQVTSPIDTPNGLAIGDRIVERHETLPSCSVTLMDHSFGNSYGKPFSAKYEPPECDFDNVYINVTVTSEGRQFDRLATMWLGDIEVWRTSTAEPTQKPGIIWHFLKDMTPYLTLWRKRQTLIFDLGNIINDKYTGPFNVTMDATFFKSNTEASDAATIPPADVIIPISSKKSAKNESSAFIFPETKAESTVEVPRGVKKAIMTVAATGQAGEEFWWSNYPESSKLSPGLSCFREVQVTINGQTAGVVWPFPVVFTGGVAPPLHRPMVGLEAFDLRETEIDITPWLSELAEGPSTLGIEVFGVNDTISGKPELVHAGSNWVLSAKIFAWLNEEERNDKEYPPVKPPPPEVQISPLKYLATAGPLKNGGHDYTQSATREITVTQDVRGWHEGPIPRAKWYQAFSMTNNCSYRLGGRYQSANSTYYGQGYATHEYEPKLATAFLYPIESISYYSTDKEQNTLALEAVLSQGLDLSVSLDSPLTTGLEPFTDILHSDVKGLRLHATRDGHAYFVQSKGNRSIGAGESSQSYELTALPEVDSIHGDLDGLDNWVLYERNVSVAKEVTVKDEEFVRGKKVESLKPHPVSWDGIWYSEFAPYSGKEDGGRVAKGLPAIELWGLHSESRSPSTDASFVQQADDS